MVCGLADYSPVHRRAMRNCIWLEVDREARAETSARPRWSLRVQRLFRLAYKLIDAEVDFNQQHAVASLSKAKVSPGMNVSDPWDETIQNELLSQVKALTHRIATLAVNHWSVPKEDARFFVATATDELQQRVYEEFEAGRDAYTSAMQRYRSAAASNAVGTCADAQSASQPSSPASIGTNARGGRGRRSTRKIDVDAALGKLEAKIRKDAKREYGSDTAAKDALVERLYSASAEAIAPVLTRDCRMKVSARTVRRSDKYKSWERYRKRLTPTSSTAYNEVSSDGLTVRSGGRGATRIGRTAKEAATDRLADAFAHSAGVTLPPAE